MRPVSLLSAGIVIVLAVLTIWQVSQSPGSLDDVGPGKPVAGGGELILVNISSDADAGAIARGLEEKGVIASAAQFRILVSLMGYDSLLQAGEYEFEPNTPALEAVLRLRRGQIASRVLTVVEGWRLEEVARAVEKLGLGTSQEFEAAAVAGNFQFDFLADLSPDESLEGYLYPATYRFSRGATVQDVLKELLSAFDQKFTPQLRREASERGLTVQEVVTLASIIEREAVVPEERPIMAQVFLTRLEQGKILAADPTVQYILGSDPASVARFGFWKRELTQNDYQLDSPYNTYQYPGLPPGPISNPRLDSILAVLRPANTDYLFFVAKPDGSHAFAETFQEHLANIEKYQQQ